MINKDFEDLKLPQYKWAHLCFLGPLSEAIFTKIASLPNLIPRVKSLKELNINFMLQEPEIFHLGYVPTLNMYVTKEKTEFQYAADKLLTVCATLFEFPYIQYYGRSVHCKMLADMVNQQLNSLVGKMPKDVRPHEPKGTLIIVDRAYDINSPIMHDMCYEVMLREIVNIRKDGAVDTLNYQRNWEGEDFKSAEIKEVAPPPPKKEHKKLQPKEEAKTLFFLGDSDPLWKNLRLLNIMDAVNKIANDMELYAKEGQKFSKVNQEEDLQRLEEILAAMPAYKDTMESFQNHQKLIKNCLDRGDEYKRLFEIEQSIISGVTESGDEVGNRDIEKNLGSLFSEFKSLSSEDLLRVILMYQANYTVPRKDIDTLSKSLSEDNKDIIDKMVWLGLGNKMVDSKKPQRSSPKLSQEDFQLFKEFSEKSKGFVPRYLPRLARMVIEASKKELSSTEFPFAGEPPEDYGKKAMPKSLGISLKKGKAGVAVMSEEKSSGDIYAQPRIILYVIGGICHQEITSILRLQQTKHINCPITLGGDCILTPRIFLK
jgi:syntaxin-binding protein 1